jgi:uncharacterized protein YsxB (DUF464 family)
MIEVHVRKDGRNRLSSFLATGHAGWAESGADVVCAAVSTVLQAAWLGLSGRMTLAWPELCRDSDAVHAIVATAALSVERIATQYPDHVRVIHERDDG